MQPMIKRTVSSSRSGTAWQWPFAMCLGLLGLGPIACSDVPVPACVVHHSCGVGGASGASGPSGASGAGSVAGTGVAADAGVGGEAGAATGAAGASGEAGMSSAGAGAGNGGAGAGNGGSAGGGAAGAGAAGGCNCVIRPVALTPPCAHHSYSKSMTVSGGSPPYQWQVLSAGWAIAPNPTDTSSAKLTNDEVAAGTSNVELKITDSRARQFTKSFTVQARDTCYFAYTALEGTDSQLELLDPLAESPAPVALQNNRSVYDFQFSPDGKFLAYRHDADQAHPTGQHISLVTLSSLQERQLGFQESTISAFSWSPNSASLAVAFVSNGETYLGGVRAPTSTEPPPMMTATAAPVQSALDWVGNEYVAFHAQLIADGTHPGQFLPDPILKRRTAFFAHLGVQGFEAPTGIIAALFDPATHGIHVQPGGNGFFVITDQVPGFTFNQLVVGGFKFVQHPDATLVSPSSRYSASNSEDDLLQVFSAEEGTLSPPVSTSKDGEGCPTLLAWAKRLERIACVADVPNPTVFGKHGEIRIFDLSPGSETLHMSTLGGFCNDDTNSPTSTGTCSPAQNNYSYGTSRAAGNARSFSATGRWLAFTTTSEIEDENLLYLADFRKGFALDRKSHLQTNGQVLTATSSTDLVFSPDENFLLLRRGNVLSEYDLTAPSSALPTTISQELTASARCLETFSGTPDQWCGNTDLVAPIRWAADSRIWAFRSAGTLKVVDNTQFPETLPRPLPGADCNQKCTGEFAFQPLLAH